MLQKPNGEQRDREIFYGEDDSTKSFLPRLRLIDSAFMITSFYPFALELRAQAFLLFGVSVKHFFSFSRRFKEEREVVAMNHLLAGA